MSVEIDSIIKRCRVYGFQEAITGMRLAKDSVYSMDTEFHEDTPYDDYVTEGDVECLLLIPEAPEFGPEDRRLMLSLSGTGQGSHRKYLRCIEVYSLLTLSRKTWVDLDTYKVATVRLSQSSRDTPKKRPLAVSDFYHGHVLQGTLEALNNLREIWINKSESAETRREAMALFKDYLPESYLQTSLWKANYETIMEMYRDRCRHPLQEFRDLCAFYRKYLPLMEDLISSTDWGKVKI